MKSVSLFLAASASALAAAAPAAAQPVDAAAGERVATTDVIRVTTQRREQAITDVPINLTAYNQERLEILGITQFDELSDFVPGLEIQEQSPNNPGFVIRGITSDSGEATEEPRVAIFQDGVSIARSRGSYVELFDMERIEVAKGPQPTLFGRGALIGGINLIQNKADIDGDGISGAGSVTAGTYSRFDIEGHVNVPITDTLALRFAGINKQRDGYVENALGGEDFNSVDLWAIRSVLSWQPTSDLRIDVIGNYQEDTPTGTSFKSGTFPPPGPGPIEPWEPAALNAFGVFEGGDELGLDREVYGVTILGDYRLNDAWSLTSISAWRAFDSVEIFDPDGWAAPLLTIGEDATGRQWSQELRAHYDAGGRMRGFFGASYFYESGKQEIPLSTYLPTLGAFFTGQPVGIDPVDPLIPQFITYDEFANFGQTTAFDVFGELAFDVTDRLELTGGLRWTTEDKQAGYYSIAGVDGFLSAGPGLIVELNNGQRFDSPEFTFDDFTWRFAATYDLNDTTNLFASYARGRRPEVITRQGTSFSNIEAETVDSYEVGVYKTLANTYFQGSVFYSEYDNFQTFRLLPGQIDAVPDDAGSATQYGVEMQLDHNFNEILSVYATYAYNFAEFDDTDDEGNVQEFAGNVFRLNPEHAISVGARAAWDLDGRGTFSILPSWTWQSEVFFDNDNDLEDLVQDEVQGDYGLVRLRFRYDEPRERFWAELFVENLLDAEYIIDAGNTGDSFGIATFIAGAPRMAGGRIGARF